MSKDLSRVSSDAVAYQPVRHDQARPHHPAEEGFTQNFLSRVRSGTVDADGDGMVSIPELEMSWSGAQTGISGMGQMPPGTGTFVNGTVTVTAGDITFEHVVGPTGCPQSIGTVTLTNSTAQVASWSLSTGGSNLAFAAPGQSSPTNWIVVGFVTAGTVDRDYGALQLRTVVILHGAIHGVHLGRKRLRVGDLDGDGERPLPLSAPPGSGMASPCGILAHGFARARCAGCGYDFRRWCMARSGVGAWLRV